MVVPVGDHGETIKEGIYMFYNDSVVVRVVLVVSSMFSVSATFAAKDGEASSSPFKFVIGEGAGYSDRNRAELVKQYRKEIASLEKQKGALFSMKSGATNLTKRDCLLWVNGSPVDVDSDEKSFLRFFLHEVKDETGVLDALTNKLASLDDEIAQYKSFLGTSHGIIGRAAYKGFAGRNHNLLFSDMTPSGLLEGLGAALAYRTMTVVGDKIEDVIRHHGGDIIDATAGSAFRKVKNKVLGGWYWLFNGGARPYTIDQITLWQNEVKNVILRDLDRYAKSAQGDQANGFGTRARVQHKFDSGAFDDAAVEGGAAVVTPADPTWVAMIDGLARDLDRLTIRLEMPKMHYSPANEADEAQMIIDGRADILDVATRLQETLQLIKHHVLLPTRVLKDLATGDLKHLMPRLKEELDQRFELFKSAVSHYHGIGLKAVAPVDNNKSSRSMGRDMYLDQP